MQETRTIAEIASYNAHVYFDVATIRTKAERLRAALQERFRVRLGRWHEHAVGPHTQPMFQIAFECSLFGALLAWLMVNHDDLSILIHPDTRNPGRDHLLDALWLGPALPLRSELLPDDVADEAGVPNSTPDLAMLI